MRYNHNHHIHIHPVIIQHFSQLYVSQVLESLKLEAHREKELLRSELEQAQAELRDSVREVCEKELPYMIQLVGHRAGEIVDEC